MIPLFVLTSLAMAQPDEAQLRAQYTLPDPAVAAVLSSQVGFGAGHYYSKRPIAGTTHLLVQGGSMGVAGYGLITFAVGMSNSMKTLDASGPEVSVEGTKDPEVTFDPDGDTMAKGAAYFTAGISIYMVDRLIDTLTAPSSAKKTSLSMIEKGKLDKKLDKRQSKRDRREKRREGKNK